MNNTIYAHNNSIIQRKDTLEFNMSTNSSLIQLLSFIRNNLYMQLVVQFYYLLVLSGCLFNLIIFNQKNLRKNPCSICFSAFNASSFLLLYLSLLPAILQVGYNIEPGSIQSYLLSFKILFEFCISMFTTFLSNPSINRANNDYFSQCSNKTME